GNKSRSFISIGAAPMHRIIAAGVALLLLITSLQVLPQENKGALDIHVTRIGSTEGVPGALITLQGPYPVASEVQISSLYTPNSKLTPEMGEQVEALMPSARWGIAPEAVAAAAMRMEAKLLGLPAPQNLPAAAPTAPPPQLTGTTNANGRFHFGALAPGSYQ